MRSGGGGIIGRRFVFSGRHRRFPNATGFSRKVISEQ
jgi:hypothetical protein